MKPDESCFASSAALARHCILFVSFIRRDSHQTMRHRWCYIQYYNVYSLHQNCGDITFNYRIVTLSACQKQIFCCTVCPNGGCFIASSKESSCVQPLWQVMLCFLHDKHGMLERSIAGNMECFRHGTLEFWRPGKLETLKTGHTENEISPELKRRDQIEPTNNQS